MPTLLSHTVRRAVSFHPQRYRYGSLALLGLLMLALNLLALASGPAAAAPAPPDPSLRAVSASAAPGAVITNGWTNVFPRLIAVSAVSTSEAWAAGEYGHLVHYAGGVWTPVDPPVLRGHDLLAISMLPAGQGWIAAENHTFRYDGTNWTEQSSGLAAQGLAIEHLAAVAPDDVWAIGRPYQVFGYNSVLHWDGAQWQIVLPATNLSLYDISMVSATDGWIAGSDPSTGGALLLHYDGTNWTPVAGPTDLPCTAFQYVAASQPGEAWVVGNPVNNTRRAIYHYRNGTWAAWLLPVAVIPDDLVMRNTGEGWFPAGGTIYHWDGTTWAVEYSGRTVAAMAALGSQVWGVGPGDGIIRRTDSGIWTQEWGGPTSQHLNSVAALGMQEAWAVGAAGTALQYTGGTWQSRPTGTTRDLFRVQMLSATDGYAVGDQTILHWDGDTWGPMATPAVKLYGIDMLGDQDGWAVGAQGTILHYDGAAWLPVSNPVSEDLYAVTMDAPNHGWAGGGRTTGVVLEYDGTTWTRRSVNGWPGPSVRDIALGPGGDEGWAVGARLGSGSSGTLLHLAAGVWTTIAQVNTPLYGLAPVGAGTVWTVGRSVLYYAGNTATYVEMPGNNAELTGVTILPGQGGWAVGEWGTILRYDGTWTPPLPPTTTPSPTSTPGSTVTSTATTTATGTPTATSGSTATSTASPTATSTPSSTVTSTATATATSMPGAPPSATVTGTATERPAATSTQEPARTATPTATSTPTALPSPSPSATPVAWRTRTPSASATTTTPPLPTGTLVPPATATAVLPTLTPCALHFSDVQRADYFYEPVHYLVCRGVISGYSDATFRPSNNTTRGQMVKIVVLGLGVGAYTPPTGATFADVPPAHPFFAVIEAAAHAGVVGGYTCGSAANEPCDPQQRPYFRPGAAVTRGQLAKIVTSAAGWEVDPPAGATFEDVPPGSPFFGFIEAASCRGIISGYTCGTGPGEPCDTGQRPYFRPGNSATRGQIAKIVYGVLHSSSTVIVAALE